MNDEQALNPIKLPPADLTLTDHFNDAGTCHERRFYTASTVAAAIRQDRDEQAEKWQEAMRENSRDGIAERDALIATLNASIEKLQDELQQLRQKPTAATPGFTITMGPQVAWLNVRTGALIRLGDLASTNRNAALIVSGELVRLYRGEWQFEVQG